MKAYIAVSMQQRMAAEEQLRAIKEQLEKRNIDPFVFVDHFHFLAGEEKEMMQEAMRHIESSDLLIAETSVKGIGIGIEAGYAKAAGKPVIYLRHQNAGHSTTLSGISDYRVIYRDTADLQAQLNDCLQQFLADC